MPKLIIDNEQVSSSFFKNSALLGIMAPLADYHFCNLIKDQIGFHFKHCIGAEIITHRKNRDYFFHIFNYTEKHVPVEHIIYNNKCDGAYLLPEFKNLDFVWLIKGIQTNEPAQQLINAISNIAAVQLVVELTHKKIKNKQHLIL